MLRQSASQQLKPNFVDFGVPVAKITLLMRIERGHCLLAHGSVVYKCLFLFSEVIHDGFPDCSQTVPGRSWFAPRARYVCEAIADPKEDLFIAANGVRTRLPFCLVRAWALLSRTDSGS